MLKVIFYFLMIAPGMQEPIIHEEPMTLEECIGNVSLFLSDARRSVKSRAQFQAGCRLDIPQTLPAKDEDNNER